MRPDDLKLDLPEGWERMGDEERETNGGGKAIAGFIRNDGVGRVLVLRDPPLQASIHDAAIAIRHRLRESIADYRHISESMVELPAGQALTTAYARTRAGTAESVTVVPMDDCTYSLVTVVVAGQETAALEAASIVASFSRSEQTTE